MTQMKKTKMTTMPQVLHRNVTEPTVNEFSRMLTLNRETLNEEDRTIELSFSSEQPYERYFGSEILSHDPEAIDLSRLNEVGVLLFAHGRDMNYGRMPIGTIEKVWIDQNSRKARALVKFDDDEDSEKVFQKVKKGIIKGVSVGYSVSSWEEVRAGKTSANGRFTGPAYVALKWQPFEISIEPTPADPSVGVGRSHLNSESEDETMKQLKRLALEAQGIRLAPDTGAGAGGSAGTGSPDDHHRGATPPPPPVNTAELQRLAAEGERSRVTEINTLCRNFSMDPSEYITNGSTVEFVKSAILEKQIQDKKPHTPSVTVVAEEVDKFRSAATDSLLLRAGRGIVKPAPGATELRNLRLRDLAVECVQRAGDNGAHLLRDEDLLRRALSPDSTFQGILSNAANKTLSQAYEEAPTTFQHWVGVGSNSDFKAAEHYRISEAGHLQLTPQNAPIPYDSPMQDEKVTKAVLTYSERWGFTRQAFINDDLSMLSRVPAAYVIAAKRGINSLVYKMLAQNPVIFDSEPLFSAAHRNLGTAGGINTETMSEARTKMRTQKDQRGIATLNIAPKYLIVPAAMETAAAQYQRSEADPSAGHSGVANVFRNAYDIVVDAELDQYSSNAWYLAAAANIADTIEVTYLRGQELPTLETDIPFDRLGIDFRIYFDYGVTVLDSRGLFMNPGEAVTG
ncbi:prohead protease/major capsid protein fusion protein [Paenibacillus provencensis]|uniref:Prohead protease/major capsid protein fusion protein n=1 Tax=Paenibacillus provencensis TaxID=441151 RepID=A0ABW3Q4L8_9BACL|nr:prohead protease/major capsid protein fusion protein [Paenibacillus sp. MER 78]MCM3129009.1 Mu-like prophage major head subunit gpT family protein [Paenibacillus sp. MER 78]